jgi:hypothetical protein
MTYKSRLLLYVGMLILLVVGMMTMSFSTARNVILEGADEHLRHAALRKVDSVRAQREELLHYTDIIGSDLRLQEYLYIITALGMSGDGLAAYYERQFSSLPADCFVILSAASEVLLGHEFKTLIEEARKKLAPGVRDHFYYQSPKGVVLVAMGPVTYQGEQLATTFVAQIMDQEWLVRQERRSEDYLLFFEKDGNILWTSNPLYGDSNINVAESRLHDHDEYFRLHEVPLYETGSDLPRLWFGVSETHLVHMLKSYQQWVYLFAALGGMTVLLVGVLMLRNFRRPLDQLMLTTEQMINGQLPVRIQYRDGPAGEPFCRRA